MSRERGSGIGMVLFVVVVLGIITFLVTRETGGNAGPAGDTARYRSELAFINMVTVNLGKDDQQNVLNSLRESIAPTGCIEVKQFDETSGEHITTHSAPLGCSSPNLRDRDPSRMYAVLSFDGEPVSTIEATLDPPSVQGNYGRPPGRIGGS